ncbi:YggS family pyridoxal phosphate-dependent enzyme [Thiolinea disciformis]|uniref:YggS family pyridoxal phosphate-dependent enzyme n=1 Tax=Thiolinea disciformis TaxID=125614 RepID=UPI0003711E87|nr:YggS family pyridoxal phosphate-dependent enzyme [Thiolinea disciformis]
MTITDNLRIIGERIRAAEQRYGREPNSVKLIAVSKHQPLTAIQEALQTQQYAFGENYVQEMQEKALALALNDSCIEWHFIGPIQTNKTRPIAELATWVHSIDRLKVAQRLNDQRPSQLAPLQVCIQVNLSEEASKSGVAFYEAEALAHQIKTLDRLQLRGLMAIPAPSKDVAVQRQVFRRLRELKDQLNQQSFKLDTLSMGMTDDMEAAIAEGATQVRIGTAIFGARNY